jgi:uncharacterized protein YndB with AHSA1/START domain
MSRSFTVTRTVAAPREAVWRAWTEPSELRWFFSGMEDEGEEISVDLRVGGAWRLLMVVNESTSYVTGGIYREIVPEERLVFSWGAIDGWPEIDPQNLDTVPLTTVELRDIADGTELTLVASFADSMTDAEVTDWLDSGMPEGWGMTVDRLVARFAAARS